MTIGYNAHAFTVIDLSVTESTIYLSAHAVSGFGGLDSAKPLSALLAEVTGDGLYKTFDWSDNTFKRTGIADSRHEMDQVDLVSEEGVDSGMRHLSLDRSYLEEGKPYLFIVGQYIEPGHPNYSPEEPWEGWAVAGRKAFVNTVGPARGQIELLSTDLQDVAADVMTIDTTMGQVSTAIADLSTDLHNLSTEVIDLENDTETLLTTIDHLTNEVGRLPKSWDPASIVQMTTSRSSSRRLKYDKGQTKEETLEILDAAGTPVDMTGKELLLRISHRARERWEEDMTVYEITTIDVDSGESHKLSFEITGDHTAAKHQLRWELIDTATSDVLIEGPFIVD